MCFLAVALALGVTALAGVGAATGAGAANAGEAWVMGLGLAATAGATGAVVWATALAAADMAIRVERSIFIVVGAFNIVLMRSG